MKIFGELESAQIENLGSDPAGTGLVAGRIWLNTTTGQYKFYDGSAIKIVQTGASGGGSSSIENSPAMFFYNEFGSRSSGESYVLYTNEVSVLGDGLAIGDSRETFTRVVALKESYMIASMGVFSPTKTAYGVYIRDTLNQEIGRYRDFIPFGNSRSSASGSFYMKPGYFYAAAAFANFNTAGESNFSSAVFPNTAEYAGGAYNQFTSRNGSNQILYANNAGNNVKDFATITNTDHTRYTIDKECIVFASQSLSGLSSDTTSIRLYDSGNTQQIVASDFNLSPGEGASSCFIWRASAGDYIAADSAATPENVLQTAMGLVFIDPAKAENVAMTGYTSKNGSNQVLFATVAQNNTSSLITLANTDHTRITANQRCGLAVTFSAELASADTIALNIYDSSNNFKYGTTDETQNIVQEGSGLIVPTMEVGDYALVVCNPALTSGLQTNFTAMAFEI